MKLRISYAIGIMIILQNLVIQSSDPRRFFHDVMLDRDSKNSTEQYDVFRAETNKEVVVYMVRKLADNESSATIPSVTTEKNLTQVLLSDIEEIVYSDNQIDGSLITFVKRLHFNNTKIGKDVIFTKERGTLFLHDAVSSVGGSVVNGDVVKLFKETE